MNPTTTTKTTLSTPTSQPRPPTNHPAASSNNGLYIPNCINQYSLHSAYTRGALLNGPPIIQLPRYGDNAIGYTSTNSPILLLDSKIYRFDHHNHSNAPPPCTPIAFATITFFVPSNRIYSAKGGDTITTLRKTFATRGKHGLEDSGLNSPVVFAVRGAFSFVQMTNGGRLVDVQGTVFGFAFPRWLEGISGCGVRCCFLSGCRRKGGEVVDYLSIPGTFVEWAVSDHFRVGLPRDEKFESMDLFSDGT